MQLVLFFSSLLFLSSLAFANENPDIFTPQVLGGCKLGDESASLTLQNGLKLLLISDPSANQNKVALNVLTGYRDDPLDIPGLAHFLEHMLFLGTKEDPSPSAYGDFITKRGGYQNAHTNYDTTTYHFSIDPSQIEPALSLFGQQFTAPLLSQEYISKEKKVIHAEFQYRKDSIYRQTLSVAKSAFFGNKQNISKFGTGNSESLSSLSDKQLTQRMRQWWEDNYSSDKMAVVFYGPQSISTLRSLAKQHFSSISKRPNSKVYPTNEVIIKTPSIAKARINDDEKSLYLLFKIPSKDPETDNTNRAFLEFLLERNLPQSFASSALGRRFAAKIHASAANSTADVNYLDIYINLHYKGGEKYWQVVQQLMQYVDSLKSKPIEQWRLDEFNTTNALTWCHKENAKVSLYAKNLNKTSAESVFTRGRFQEKVDPEAMRELLEAINVNNMLAVVVHPDFGGSKESAWYDIEYDLEEIPERSIKNYLPGNQVKFYIDRPEPNPYLPSQIEKLTDSQAQTPQKIEALAPINAWYARDTSFDDPRIFYYVEVRSDDADSSAKSAAHTTLIRDMLRNQLKYTRAQASDAKSGVSVSRIPNGIGFYFEGYPESVKRLVQDVANRLDDFKMRDRLFERFHYGWIHYLKEQEKIDPSLQADELIESLLVGPHYSFAEQQSGMRSTRESGIRSQLKTLKENSHIQSLAYGNVSENLAIELNKVILNVFKANGTANASNIAPITLPTSISRVYSESEYEDSVNLIYIQGEEHSIDELSKFLLLDRIMSHAFYSELRTEQSLGYAVNANMVRYGGTPGMEFSIQSPYAEPQQLEENVIAFLDSFGEVLATSSPKSFSEISQTLQTDLRKPALTLNTQAVRAWRSVKHERANFDYREQMAKAIGQISLTDFSSWYTSRFSQPNRRLASVLVSGQEHSVPWSWKFSRRDSNVGDFEDFAESQRALKN